MPLATDSENTGEKHGAGNENMFCFGQVYFYRILKTSHPST